VRWPPATFARPPLHSRPVIAFDDMDLPRVAQAKRPVTSTWCSKQLAMMSAIHEHVLTRDQLIAELRLENRERVAKHDLRTEAVSVDLMA
jgi:hypothetical protein